MPIGPYGDFAELKAHLRKQYAKKGKQVSVERMNAITAGTAERIRPGWHKEAVQARKEKG